MALGQLVLMPPVVAAQAAEPGSVTATDGEAPTALETAIVPPPPPDALAPEGGHPGDAPSAPPERPALVEVRGRAPLVLHRLLGSIATDIPSVTIDEWEAVCAVPCAFAPDREAAEVYGLSHGGSVLRADDQPIFWLDAEVLSVELVDRSDVRAAGVALLTVLSVAGLLVTLVPSFVHVEPDGAIATTLIGSGLVVAGTAAGLPLIFWGDTARVRPE